MPKTKDFNYVYSVGQIDKIFKKIQSSGRPDHLTIGYVQKTWVLKNAQFSAVIDLLKAMKFLNSDGSPTDLYAKYQNGNLSEEAITEGTRNAYPKLFKAYPKAQELSKTELEGYIKQQSGADNSVVAKIYATIRRLCSLGNFDNESASQIQTDGTPSESRAERTTTSPISGNLDNAIAVNINIQLTVPETADEKIYEAFFKAMKKHLLS